MSTALATHSGSWLDKLSGGRSGGLAKAQSHATVGIRAIRQTAEVAVTSAALAAASVELTDGLDFHKVPLDLATGVAGVAAAILLPNEGIDFCNVSSAGFAIFTFRKTAELLKKHKKPAVKGSAPSSAVPRIASSSAPKIAAKRAVPARGKTRVRGDEVSGDDMGAEFEGESDVGAEAEIGADPVLEAAKNL